MVDRVRNGPTVSDAHHYRAYGLRLRSDIPIPHFAEASPVGPDVTVRYGAVPTALAGATHAHRLWQAGPNDFLLNVSDTARYRVSDGRKIVVEPLCQSDHRIAALLAAGSVWTALLQQRTLLTLHASAVHAGDGAALFLGASGAGKSSLALAFAARGYPVICDDIAAVRLGADGAPAVVPGYPGLRLWRDVLDRFDYATDTLRRVRPELDKYLLPASRFSKRPQAVRAVYVLTSEKRNTIRFNSLPPGRAFMWLTKYSHRRKFVHAFGRREAHFRAVAHIAEIARVVRVTRPAGAFLLDAVADRIESDIAASSSA